MRNRFKNTIFSAIVISSFLSLSLLVTQEGMCHAYADFTYSPEFPDVGDVITFTSTGSGYGESWYFGDGTSGHGRVVTHTYLKKGSYRVTLSVEDREYYYDPSTNDWEWRYDYDSTSKFVRVGFPYPEFDYNPKDPIAWQNVTFDASESTDPVGEILYYNWSCIDTRNPNDVIQMGTGEIFTYFWPRQGTYNVTVTETDDKNNINEITKKVIVSNLRIGEVKTRRNNISIQIENIGNFTVQDIDCSIFVSKSIFGRWRRIGYNETIDSLGQGETATINFHRFRRFYGFVYISIAIESDNAQVTEIRHGFMLGRFVHLRRERN